MCVIFVSIRIVNNIIISIIYKIVAQRPRASKNRQLENLLKEFSIQIAKQNPIATVLLNHTH